MSAPCSLHGARLTRARLAAAALSAGLAWCVATAGAAAPRADDPIVLLRPRAGGPFSPVADVFRSQTSERVVEVTMDDRDPALAEQDVRAAHPAVIVALGPRAARLAHDRFGMVPLVYGLVGDPARLGLTGDNVTGVSAEVSPAVELAALREIVPGVTRVALIYGSDASDARLRDTREAARRAGVTLVEVSVQSPAELPDHLRAAIPGVSALWLAPDVWLATPEPFRFLVELSIQHRKPLFVFAPPLVRAGALAAAAPDVDWVGHELADRVRRIRAGTRAGDLPESAARSARVVFNPATARAIGVAMPARAQPLTDAGVP